MLKKLSLFPLAAACAALLNAAPEKITGFENAILDETAEIQSADGKRTTRCLTDDDPRNEFFRKEITMPNGSVIAINPKTRINAKGIQIFSGDIRGAKNPSGTCALKSVLVEGFVNGQWVELAKENNIKDYDPKSELTDDLFFWRFDFPEPVSVDNLKITILDSHDTGMRRAGSTDKRIAVIREIQFFSTTPMQRQFTFADLVMAEYTLPVYRNSKTAKLTIIVEESERAPKEAELTIFSPENKKIFSEKIQLKTGENTKVIDIAGFENGRYATFIKTSAGQHKRLLRIDNIPEIEPPAKALDMAGKKFLFTPDKFTFKSSENISVQVSQAKATEVARQPSEEHLALKSDNFYRAVDGSFVMEITDYKYRDYFTKPSGKRIFAADKPEGPYREIKSAPPPPAKPEPIFKKFRPDAPIIPFPKCGPEKIKYEFYDKSVHGEIPLNNIRVFFSYRSLFLDFIKKPMRAIWCVAKTKNGKWVMFSKKPLFRDVWRFYGDMFDDGWQTNDNFAGQWLSFEPGKNELFYAHGQTLRRDAPYDIPYDNIAAFRYLALYSTTNGVDWKFRNYIDVPTERDARGAQQYGATLLQMKDADLALLYVLEYDCAAQQIYLDLKYTRNGIHFYGFPNSKPFLRTLNPKDWYFGHVFMEPRIYRAGGEYAQEITRGSNSLHFSPEVCLRQNKLSDITEKSVRDRFEKRRFEQQFTFFKTLGGYAGVAELCRNLNFSAGVLTFRVDGWFAAAAGGKEGCFTTNNMRNAKEMSANFEVKENGFIRVRLKDASGNVIEEKSLDGDHLKLKVFDKIPDGEFFLEVRMRNAKIYALYFK